MFTYKNRVKKYPKFIINEVFQYVLGYDVHPTKFTAFPADKQQQLLYVI